MFNNIRRLTHANFVDIQTMYDSIQQCTQIICDNTPSVCIDIQFSTDPIRRHTDAIEMV